MLADAAAPGDRGRGASPAFRHKLAIAIAADSESTAPPCETRPKPASREAPTVAGGANALRESSPGTAVMNVPVSSSCCCSGSEYSPRSPRSRSNERLRCVPEIDEATEEPGETPSTKETNMGALVHGSLARTGSFSKCSTSDSFRAKRGAGARGALCRASHAVIGADDDFKV